MPETEALAARIARDHPNLVMSLSGPWEDGSWICNFKDRELGLRTIHPGSSGKTLTEALEAGARFADSWAAERDAQPAP